MVSFVRFVTNLDSYLVYVYSTKRVTCLSHFKGFPEKKPNDVRSGYRIKLKGWRYNV